MNIQTLIAYRAMIDRASETMHPMTTTICEHLLQDAANAGERGDIVEARRLLDEIDERVRNDD